MVFVTRWVPGQTQSHVVRTDLHRRENGRWVNHELPVRAEEIADAAGRGNVFVEVVRDGGCCGWVNQNADQALVVRNGRPTVIYDERERFRNDDYDVSFFTLRVKLSPDEARVAFTIAGTALPGEEIRLSDSGKDDPEELRRMRRAIGELPQVNVSAVAVPGRVVVTEPGELVGWLDGRRLLIVQAGELVVVDAAGGAKTPTRIKADSAGHVFVR